MKLRRAKHEEPKPIVLPAVGEQLIVSTEAGGHIPARVTEQGCNSLTIAIMVPIKPFTSRELAALVLEYSDARGRVRLQGSASVVDRAEPDLLRVEDPRSIEVLQQREYVRIRSARPVVVYAGRDTLEVQSYTVDLSGGGFLLAGPDSLKAGDEVRFRLSLAQGATPITGRGEVVRVDGRARLAVAFRDISDLDRRRLVRFIFDAQRIERRRGLDMEGRHGS